MLDNAYIISYHKNIFSVIKSAEEISHSRKRDTHLAARIPVAFLNALWESRLKEKKETK